MCISDGNAATSAVGQ